MDQVIERSTANARRTLTVYEAAKALGISRNGAYELVREGRLRSVRVGVRILVPSNAIDEFLSGQ